MRYDQPVGSQQDRDAATAWAGGWFDASGYGRDSQSYYNSQGAWHTGSDLNLPAWADSRKQVFSAADGVVVFVGTAAGWQGRMVVVKHPDGMWTRYAHLAETRVAAGANVKRGDWLAIIGDYLPAGVAADHLHFDVARIDLGARPGDWPAQDIARLERDYVDPLEWINTHRVDEVIDMGKWTPSSTDGTRVRLTPDTTGTANIAGVIPGAAVVDGDLSGDGKWVQVQVKPERMTVSGVALVPSVNATFVAYAASQFMKPATVQPTPPTSLNAIGIHPALPALAFNKRLGVHTLERIEEAREAWALGCRSFTMMNNVGGAREIRQMGAAVIVRCYMDGGQLWSVDQFIQRFGVNANDSFIVMGINEADNISTSEIEKRFAWEQEFALKMHAVSPKSFIVIGGFSMGTPQLDDPSTATRFRNTYGAFLNANASWCGLNYHSYHRRHSAAVPPASEKVEDPAWWPKRFLNWGYNAQAGGMNNNVVMVSDEAGVDIGGVGGFPACGYNDDTFMLWWEMQRAWFEPVPQVYTQNIFQLSPRQDWAGYNARCVLGGMARVWQSG
jgi:murein DD-endopeptidase MepM/ murein hydrolase activator NlpD